MRYLYSPHTTDGARDWSVEERLSDLESILARIWPTLAEDFIDIDGNESLRKGLSLFLATLYLRHPSQREVVRRIHGQMVALFESAPKDSDGVPVVSQLKVGDRTIELDRSDWSSYRVWTKNDYHRSFVRTIEQQAHYVAELLLEKRWSVIVSDEPLFITTDNPLLVENPKKERFGLGTHATVISFPLSPTRLLVMDDNHGEPSGQYYPLGDHGPGPFNLGLWRRASEFMISHRPSDLVMTEMLQWADSYEQSQIDV